MIFRNRYKAPYLQVHTFCAVFLKFSVLIYKTFINREESHKYGQKIIENLHHLTQQLNQSSHVNYFGEACEGESYW